MAKFSPSFLISQVSGKVGGIVFTPGKNSATVRTKRYKTARYNENTSLIKSFTPSLISNFNSLPEPVKKAWQDRRILFPQTDRFGRKFFLSGQTLYVKANFYRLFAFGPVNNDPPELFNYPTFSGYELLLDPGQFEFSFSEFLPMVGDLVFIYATRPLSPGIQNPSLKLFKFISVQRIEDRTFIPFYSQYTSKFGPEPYPAGSKIFAYFFVLPRNVSALPSIKYFSGGTY